MKKFFLLLIILLTNPICSQSFINFQFTGGGNTVFNNQFTMFSRIGEIFAGVTQNDQYILYVGSIYNFETSLLTGMTEEKSILPIQEKLFQNYPNPFNPTTTIKYQIPYNGYVTLKVFDLLGREIITLVNEEKLPGRYEVLFDGRNLTSGIYFYQIRCENFSDTKKLLLVK